MYVLYIYVYTVCMYFICVLLYMYLCTLEYKHPIFVEKEKSLYLLIWKTIEPKYQFPVFFLYNAIICIICDP